jgi:hypothetical protein
MLAADFNADGFDDILVSNNNGSTLTYTVFTFNAIDFDEVTIDCHGTGAQDNLITNNSTSTVGDFNGDGLKELVTFDDGHISTSGKIWRWCVHNGNVRCICSWRFVRKLYGRVE